MAINKSLNIGLKRAHKQEDWIGFDAVQVVPTPLVLTEKCYVDAYDVERIPKKAKELSAIKGFVIDEFIDDDTLSDQIKNVTNYANSEKTKYDNTSKSKYKYRLVNANAAGDQFTMYNALNLILNAMLKEQKLRDAVNIQIQDAQRNDSLASWEALKNSWRTIAQKKTIEDAIKRVKDQIKASEQAAKIEAEKQAKLDALNKKKASTTDINERKAIDNQISELMGTVSEQTGMPKGSLYFGIGIAVVVGIWITIRAIRK